jgi:hypothetical protein
MGLLCDKKTISESLISSFSGKNNDQVIRLIAGQFRKYMRRVHLTLLWLIAKSSAG